MSNPDQKEVAPKVPISEQPRSMGITDKGKIALLEYEAKTLKRTILILGLTTTCLAVTVIFLALR